VEGKKERRGGGARRVNSRDEKEPGTTGTAKLGKRSAEGQKVN